MKIFHKTFYYNPETPIDPFNWRNVYKGPGYPAYSIILRRIEFRFCYLRGPMVGYQISEWQDFPRALHVTLGRVIFGYVTR